MYSFHLHMFRSVVVSAARSVAIDIVKNLYIIDDARSMVSYSDLVVLSLQEATGPHLAEIDEHTPNSRVFRNYAGVVQQ
jgi:hypothetical protein